MSETAAVDLTQKWTELAQAAQNFMHAWSVAMTPVIEAISRFCEGFCEIAWKAYLEAGAPYGETDDGMWRWLRERAEAERLRRRADEIELYHRQMVGFRKMLNRG